MVSKYILNNLNCYVRFFFALKASKSRSSRRWCKFKCNEWRVPEVSGEKHASVCIATQHTHHTQAQLCKSTFSLSNFHMKSGITAFLSPLLIGSNISLKLEKPVWPFAAVSFRRSRLSIKICMITYKSFKLSLNLKF